MAGWYLTNKKKKKKRNGTEIQGGGEDMLKVLSQALFLHRRHDRELPHRLLSHVMQKLRESERKEKDMTIL